MGKRITALTAEQQAFIARQKLFFVATAAADGRVNVSPKGMDTLRVCGPSRIAWLNLTGSGNETAAHLLESNRLTLMWCAFEGEPLILRAYGQARAVHPHDRAWPERLALFPSLAGARQVVDVAIDLVQTSCGMAVPYFDYRGEREALRQWAEKKGADGLRRYWEEHNTLSLDGKPTKIISP
jgi:hypothetical protein